MKKYIYALLLAFTTVNLTYAQVPDSINYQAVIRNANGTLIAINKTVNFKFIVTVGSSNYTETQSHTITNKFGLANLKIGAGIASSSITKLKNLPWSQGNATLTVDIDTTGGTSFTNISTTSLVTVPYALYSDKADKANTAITANTATTAGTATVANDIANLNFNSNTLTVGTKTTTIPIPVVKRDTIVTAFSNTNNLAITPTPGGAPGGGTNYNIIAKTQDLAITNTSTNTLTLSKNGIGDNINFNQGNGIKINSTAGDINFSIDDAYIKDSIKSFIKDTLKSITRVRFSNSANKTYIYTPLPKLKLNTITNILTIYDTLKPLANSIDLSHLANRDTVVKVVAGTGIKVGPSSLGNVKTFTVTNRFPADSINFFTTGGRTQITGTYPNYKVYSDTNVSVPYTLSSFSNYMSLSINNSPSDLADIISSNKLKRTGNSISSKINDPSFQPSQTNDSTTIIDGIVHNITGNKLTTTINGITSVPISIFDTITLKMPLLYNDVTINGGSNKILTPILKTQPINTFLAGPATGVAAAPTFRGLDDADLASLKVVSYLAPSNPNYVPKFGSTPNKLTNSKLYEDPTVGTTLGFIGWNTTTPKNNFVINSSTTSTLQLTSNAGLATSGFVAKFNGTDSYLSTKNDMLFTDDLASPIVRLKINNSNVFVGNPFNPIALNLSKDLITNSSSGNNNDVLTSQGAGAPPQWKPAASANIWTKSGNTIFETIPTDNVTLGNSTNINTSVKLAVVPTNSFDTAIYAKSLGRYAMVGETTDGTKKSYAVTGITNGLGSSALQINTSTALNYSAGVFGESKTATNNITYGVMGKTASTNQQAAGVFGIAEAGGSDGVRGITVSTSRGSAASFLNYANGNSTPTVYISNRDVNDSAAALYVEGGQIVKTKVVTGNYSQNRGDYIIISNANAGNTNVITLLDPATVIEGTVVIVRNVGAGSMKIDLATGTAATSTIDVYSDKINNLGASITSTPGITSILATAGTPSSVVVTTLATVNTSLKFVSTKNGTTGTWIEY